MSFRAIQNFLPLFEISQGMQASVSPLETLLSQRVSCECLRLQTSSDCRMLQWGCGIEMTGSLGNFQLIRCGYSSCGSSDAALWNLANKRG